MPGVASGAKPSVGQAPAVGCGGLCCEAGGGAACGVVGVAAAGATRILLSLMPPPRWRLPALPASPMLLLLPPVPFVFSKLLHLAFQISSSRRSSSSLVENLSIKAAVARPLSSADRGLPVTLAAAAATGGAAADKRLAPPVIGAGDPSAGQEEDESAGLRSALVALRPAWGLRAAGLTAALGLRPTAVKAGTAGVGLSLTTTRWLRLPPAAPIAATMAVAAAAAAFAAATAVAILPRTTKSLPRRAFSNVFELIPPSRLACLAPASAGGSCFPASTSGRRFLSLAASLSDTDAGRGRVAVFSCGGGLPASAADLPSRFDGVIFPNGSCKLPFPLTASCLPGRRSGSLASLRTAARARYFW